MHLNNFKNSLHHLKCFLIEVKFTENDFTKCGGYASNGNSSKTKLTCENGEMLLNDFQTCYLQGANGKSKLHRKYLDFFDKTDFSEIAFSQKCPFILNHQCIRNQSLLRALISENKIDNGYFVLLHHDLNESIKKEWDLYLNNLSDKAKKEVLKISASDLVKESANENFRNYFKDRYLI